MSDNTISSVEIRKALASHVASKAPSETLQQFLTTDAPEPWLVANADKEIIAYLNEHSTPTYGKGARFFLPIPKKFGEQGIGEALIYSEGERAGQPIKKDGAQIGVKFKNAVDGIEQAVRGDGQSVVIIGGAMTGEKAALLQQKLETLTGGTGDPEALDLHGVKALLTYSAQELGLDDIWTGSIGSVLKAAPVDGHEIVTDGPLKQYAGYFTHKPEPGKEIAAVHINGGAKFSGDVAGGLQDYAASPGFFATLGFSRDGQSQYRGVAEEAFCRDYVNGAEKACHAGMLFNVDAETKAVSAPAKSRIGGRTDHPSIAAFTQGGRSAT